jgi:benzoate/toluate 1,2-dioxygenase alpha subunit/p-cumate 2,3-dioxygenase alpha subunit
MIIDSVCLTVRKIDPVGVGALAVSSWSLAPKGEAESLRALRKSHYLTFLGPAGFATPDDIEIVESCQLGSTNSLAMHSDFSRGMGSATPLTTDELPGRAFWLRWRQLMLDS